MKITTVLLLFLAFSASARGDTFDLGGRGTLSIAVPDSWTARGRDLGGKAFDLTIRPQGDANAQCKITLFHLETKSPPDKETLKKNVLLLCQRFVAGSVEKKAVLKELKLKGGYGAFCSFTDESLVGKPPIRGNYKTMTSGMVEVSEVVNGAVTILSDSLTGAEFKAMLAMVESLEHRKGDSSKR